MHVTEIEPMAARLTRDIDVAVDRKDLEAIAEAARPFGFRYRHTASMDMLVDAEEPKAHSAAHLVFTVPAFSRPVR